jgi:hypothetical protein
MSTRPRRALLILPACPLDWLSMKTALTLFALAALSAAGPVAGYLGIHVDRQTIALRSGRDSMHVFLPSPSDTVRDRSSIDTTTVIAETTYEGLPAWLSRVSSDTLSTVDTVCEDGDTLLVRRQVLDTFRLRANLYKVPFAVGSWWRTGTAGTYYYDITGDTLADTITVWGDTTRVVDFEDVTVPWGTVTGCTRLLHVARQSLAGTYQGVPVRETSYTRAYEWYKDSMSWVKDSTCVTAVVYTQIIIWLHTADVVDISTGVLAAFRSGIEQAGSDPARPALELSPTICRAGTVVRISCSLAPSSLALFSADGRLVSSFVISTSDFVIPALPAGTYFLRAAGYAPTVIVKTR